MRLSPQSTDYSTELILISSKELYNIFRGMSSYSFDILCLFLTSIHRLCDEPKIKALLDVARELKG